MTYWAAMCTVPLKQCRYILENWVSGVCTLYHFGHLFWKSGICSEYKVRTRHNFEILITNQNSSLSGKSGKLQLLLQHNGRVWVVKPRPGIYSKCTLLFYIIRRLLGLCCVQSQEMGLNLIAFFLLLLFDTPKSQKLLAIKGELELTNW